MFRYIEGVRKPPDGAIAAGRAFDATTNNFYLDRLAFGETMSDEDVRAFYAARFDEEAGRVDKWHDPRGELLDRGVGVASTWRKRVGVFVTPRQMQGKLTVQVADDETRAELNDQLGLTQSFELRGYLDLIGDVPKLGETIIDHKLAGRSWNVTDVLRATQPLIYAKATGIRNFQFHIGRRDLKTPRVQVLGRKVSRSASETIVRVAGAARRKIRLALTTGDWLPNRGNNLCSRRWCAYWDRCEKRYGGRVPD